MSKYCIYKILDPEQQMLFEGRAAWETMQAAVIQRLEALQ